MTLLSDGDIVRMSGGDQPLIDPCNANIREHGIISHGPSSYGYDVSLAPEFKVFRERKPHASASTKFREELYDVVIDPKDFENSTIIGKEGKDREYPHSIIKTIEADEIIVQPRNFVLGRTREYIRVPNNVTGLFFTKSTYARCGLNITTTILEAGWQGELVVEIYNVTDFPIKLYANEGIGQILFFVSDNKCDQSYADRDGKYMNQSGVQTAKIKN